MNAQEAWIQFMKVDVLPRRLPSVLELHDSYVSNREELIVPLIRLMDELCREVCDGQANGQMEACIGIRFSLLRTSLLEQRPVYMLEAYDESSVEALQVTPYRYDAGWIFKHIEDWYKNSELERRKYVGQVEACGLEAWMHEQTGPFQVYMVHAARFAMEQVAKLDSFQSIRKGKIFDVRVGEYRDTATSESVYRMNQVQRPSMTCKGWLANLLKHQYIYEHICQVDVSQGQYPGIRLNYARLEEVDLTGSEMTSSYLLGTRFERSVCDDVNWSRSVLIDTDFRQCSLTHARFDYGFGRQKVVHEQEAVVFGVQGVLFHQADLSYASFRHARISGDFRGAVLEGVDFTGADLTGSIMLRSDQEQVLLSDKQRHSIQWMDEPVHSVIQEGTAYGIF